MSIFKSSCSESMDYSKYLNCPDCRLEELYCKRHRIEVESNLHRIEIKNMLGIQNFRSKEYFESLRDLQKSYEVWKFAQP